MAKAVSAADKAAEKKREEYLDDHRARCAEGKPMRSMPEWKAGVEPADQDAPPEKPKAKKK